MLLFALVAAGPVALSAQTDQPAAQTDGAKDKSPDEDAEPGQGKISSFGESLATFWSVSSAFQATQSFDDNVFLANSFRKSDTLTKLSGRITVAYRGRHTRYEATYMPEFNLYQRYEPLNYSAHNFNQSLRHQFNRRLELQWKVNARRAPSRGNLPFTVINFGGLLYNMYSLEALQNGLNIFNGTNSVQLSYKFNPRIKITGTVEGAASLFTERGSASTVGISNELIYSVGGSLGVDYSLNPRRSVGVRVSSTYFGFVGPSGHQYYQSVRGTFNQQLPRHFNLGLSIGPGVTTRQGAGRDVSTFFDVSLGRNLQRSGFAVSFRRSTQVGLLQGSISGYGGGFRANRNFGRKWITNLGGSYTRSNSALGTGQLEAISGSAQVGYRLTQRIIPFINYGYTHQKNLSSIPGTRNVDRNEVLIGFVYNFGVVAGR